MKANQKETSFWVSELISGRDPTEMPKEQIDEVYNVLLNEKEKAISRGAVTDVKTIQDILNAINEIQNEALAASFEKEQPEPVADKKEDTEVLDKALQSIIRGNNLRRCQVKLIPRLIQRAKEQKQKCIDDEDFRQAQAYEDALQYLLQHKGKCGTDEKRLNKYEHTVKLHNNAAETLYNEEEKRDNELKEFDENCNLELSEFEKQYEQQCRAFEESIPKELPARFVKRTNQYLTMRKVEKSLLDSKRYTEAADIKERADKLDKIEAMENRAKFDEKNQQTRNKMAIDHKKQRECIEENQQRKRQKIVMEYEARIADMRLAVDNVERKLIEMEDGFSKKPLSVPKNKNKADNPRNTSSVGSSPFITQGKDRVTVATQTLKRYRFPKKC